MAISTVSNITGYFNNIYEDALFVAREMNMMTNLVTNYSATGWMTRTISTYPTFTAASVSEGVDYANPTTFDKSTLATLTPGEIITQAIITDRRMDTDPQDARRDVATEMGNAIATKIDKDVASSFSSFTTDVGPGAGTTNTLAKFAVGVSVLRNSLAPQPLYVVIHPYQWHDIFVELGQPASQKVLLGDVANRALQDFYVGNWLNLQWFVSTNVPTSTTNATGAIFNSQSIAFDTRKAPTLEPERDASLRAWELNLSAGYAYGVRRNAFGVKYTGDITTPT
jgi:hypothetical protein